MLHRVSLLAVYDKTGKSFQARGRMNAATCTESKNKKCYISNSNYGVMAGHGNTVTRRELEPFAS